MKVAILAGGLGTRLREETEFRPKPMIEIGGRPILWHIMKSYAHHGHTEFVLCLGFRGDAIRQYFTTYEVRNRDITVTLGTGEVQVHDTHSEVGWKITLAETGEKTMTGGRLRRVARYLGNTTFLATYGDGVADVDIGALLEFHRQSRKLATVTAVRPSSRFGELAIDGSVATGFHEKPQVHEGWINGGFFVFEPAALDLIEADDETLENGLLTKLTARRELAVYCHNGFWQCMDTAREMDLLNDLWRTGRAPWAVWR
ncbi:MAG: glucose-1-phosphate cytidylyltransferase [Candidatus Wallbacteria bacterium]|nr:glucose-1-phosphate cytidylyltransferase [Candidatus Wallbacteria bacterium]